MTWYMPSWQKREIRMALCIEQAGKCAYCSRSMTLDIRHARKAHFATLDHLTPLALGGQSHAGNFVACCRMCNIVKGHATLEEFIFGLLWYWLCRQHPILACRIAEAGGIRSTSSHALPASSRPLA